MSANRAVTLALAAAMALTGPSLQAQASHRGGGGRPGGGGGRGGGGHPGGSYAVPRGGAPAHPAYSPRGGVAATRHPQAGTGRYSYHPGYGGHHSGYGGRYPGYGGYYARYGRHYYGSNSYGYYRPYWSASLYFGWPYYSAGWWPYGYYSPSYSVSYYGHPVEAPVAQPEGDGLDSASDAPRPAASNRDVGRIRLEVRPDDASVYVDDEFWGNARDTRFLTLRSGPHTIELVRPGFEVVRRDVDVVRGETGDVFVELQRP